MTLRICRLKGTEYIVVESLHLTFQITRLGTLTRVLDQRSDLNERVWDSQVTYPLDFRHPHINQVNDLIRRTAENIQKIALRLNLHVEGEGIECCENFNGLIESNKLDQKEELDLSGLELDYLPFHIGMFKKLQTLNLSHNHLRILPPDISLLTHLKVINLTGNEIVTLPTWLTEMRGLTIIREDEVRCETEQLTQIAIPEEIEG